MRATAQIQEIESRRDLELLVKGDVVLVEGDDNKLKEYVYVGKTTPLDMMNVAKEQSPVSPDAMDTNWGGSDYTQSLIDKGYYK